MQVEKFEIENFKGIKSLELEISTVAPGNVITLIGLNESGKTTILEAMSHFISVDQETSSIVEAVSQNQSMVDLLPMAKKGNFSGEISVKVEATLEPSDIEDLERHVKAKLGYFITKDGIRPRIKVRRVHEFKDGDFTRSKTRWTIHVPFQKKKDGKNYVASGSEIATMSTWNAITSFLSARFPRIVYFPTFLFTVPERIYLEDLAEWEKAEDADINNYFRQVMQDVADSIDKDLSIKRHIVDKIARHREEMASDPFGFYQVFKKKDEKKSIDAVVNRLAGAISRTIFSSWNRIFDQKISGKSVKIEWDFDPEKGNIPYLQILIHDGEHDYLLHQRSLGFRWFFTFLLFTQFRKSRSTERGTIFLFDEPASNLHAQAQMKLLDSFGKTATGEQYIVYSTHSHYMIDPLRLEKAYIVENRAVDFESEDAALSFSLNETDVGVTRYRRFVAQHPKRVSYFQPALDALKFSFGPLVAGERVVIVEGKFDFHPLRYFAKRLKILDDVTFIPAPSASEAGTLISMMRGLGSRFIVLLDGDGPGEKAAARYREQHLLSEDQVLTLGNLDAAMKGRPFEALYSDQVIKRASVSGHPTKGEFSLLFQELLIEGDFDVGLGQTPNRLRAILEKLKAQFEKIPAADAASALPKRAKAKTKQRLA